MSTSLGAWCTWRQHQARLQKLGIRTLIRWMRGLLKRVYAGWATLACRRGAFPGTAKANALARRRDDSATLRAVVRWRVAVGDLEWERAILVRIAMRLSTPRCPVLNTDSWSVRGELEDAGGTLSGRPAPSSPAALNISSP